MIPTGILERIREGSDLFMQDTAAHYVYTGTTTHAGIATPSYADPVQIRIRLNTRFGYESETTQKANPKLSQVQSFAIVRAHIPRDVIVSERDRIVFTDERGVVKTYDVTHAPPVHAHTGAYIIELREVKI